MEFVSLEQDQDGVTARVLHHHDGTATNLDIRASYIIGTDGAKGEYYTLFTFRLMFLIFYRCYEEAFEPYFRWRDS